MQPDDDQLVGGTVLRRPAIRSPDFVTQVSGWSINIDGSAEFNNVELRGQLKLVNAVDTTTVVATRHPGDAFDVFSINILGTMGWGTGAATTDAYLARVDVGELEIGSHLQLRGFGALTDTLLNVLQDGEGNGRWFVRANGQLRWGDGTNPSDTTLERASAGVLTMGGISLLPNSSVTNVQPAGTQTINTTTFTSVTGVSRTFTKNFSAAVSSIVVRIMGKGFVSAVDNITLAVQVNGVDTTVDIYRFNAINDYRSFGGIVKITGLAAGAYTATARVKVATGTTTFTTGASVSGWSIEVEETTP